MISFRVFCKKFLFSSCTSFICKSRIWYIDLEVISNHVLDCVCDYWNSCSTLLVQIDYSTSGCRVILTPTNDYLSVSGNTNIHPFESKNYQIYFKNIKSLILNDHRNNNITTKTIFLGNICIFSDSVQILYKCFNILFSSLRG